MYKIAIVYDWLDKWGGVERVLINLHELLPEAEFFTSYQDLAKAPWSRNLKVRTSFIQKLPRFMKTDRVVSLPFYPYAFESFDFSKYDLVISVTSSFAKSIITKPGTKHICYLLTPTRYLWIYPELYFQNNLFKILTRNYLTKLREWDFIAAQRPDKIISLSETVAKRCKKYYQRDSEIIHPPFDSNYWEKIKSKVNIQKSNLKLKFKNYFLVVSRLEPYKRIDLVISAFDSIKENLVIVGEGSQQHKLKKTSGNNVIFLNQLTDYELGYLYTNSKALIMPEEEDFGYVALEAQIFNCPVLAYRKGGATETVNEPELGLFFENQTVKALIDVVKKFNMIKYKIKANVKKYGPKNIERFAKQTFAQKIKAVINSNIRI